MALLRRTLTLSHSEVVIMSKASGLIGGTFFLLVLSAVGAAILPAQLPHWGYFMGAAALCAVLSVLLFRKR